MRGWIVSGLITVASAAHAQAGTDASEPSVGRRADSIAQLDPAGELQRALARGDRRCVAVQGYAAMPAFEPIDSLLAVFKVLCADGMHVVPGTSDMVTPGVGQLDHSS